MWKLTTIKSAKKFRNDMKRIIYRNLNKLSEPFDTSKTIACVIINEVIQLSSYLY